MNNKEQKRNYSPWLKWSLIILFILVILFVILCVYFYESEEDIKEKLGFYEDFSKTNYDKYYPEYDIDFLVENNIIEIARENGVENEYGLNRTNKTFSIIMDSEEPTDTEIILEAKVLALGAKGISDDYNVQIFLDNNLREPILFLHNVDVIYSLIDENTSLEDIEKYQ